MGDSYAAGPGAGSVLGTDFTCLRSRLSYPPQLDSRITAPPSQWASTAFRFLACTGAVTADIDGQLGGAINNLDLVTLSIGGNDLEFSTIIKACMYRPFGRFQGSCDDALNRARSTLLPQLRGRLRGVLDRITRNGTPRQGVAIQLYPSFFNADTPWCNTFSLGIWPGSNNRPLLTHALRRSFNSLSSVVRNDMVRWLREYQAERRSLPSNDGRYWDRDLINIFDEDDTLYDGHRFCEEAHEGTFNNDGIWIFSLEGHNTTGRYETEPSSDLRRRYDPDSCADDPRYLTLSEQTWACDLARYHAHPEGLNNDVQARFPRLPFLARIFHPKPAAFAEIALQHSRLIVNRPTLAAANSEEEDQQTDEFGESRNATAPEESIEAGEETTNPEESTDGTRESGSLGRRDAFEDGEIMNVQGLRVLNIKI